MSEQIQTALAALHNILGDMLLAVYLHGSAVSGRLQPQSDIDLLAITERDLTEDQRDGLLTALLRISGRHPATAGGARCLEVMLFRRSDLARTAYPARAEFIYGEWLRDGFEAGERPMPTRDPEHTLVLAQARQDAIPLFGAGADKLLPEIPQKHVRRAIGDALPALLGGIHGDERNVLLTLARMWRTASTGEFVTKDAAAVWAIPQIQSRDASTLDYARRAYLGELADDWSSRSDATQRLAAYLRDQVIESL
ncbi:aminoglycoside adenylyltransferase family protein [Paracoccus onubensis]|uniref:Aminoglycoside (3'') (9) adenylyltransferase n=1 Tax=Paracoccus onubensis TaxID=1675788 RepID=A0A418STE5_9RHOB|nr:aminoglycoside adenylyltransferase family protein [Paracoccus onubensis]RJE84147.1 DUF4111 domain-containing protein [Paracoccus onubensis]